QPFAEGTLWIAKVAGDQGKVCAHGPQGFAQDIVIRGQLRGIVQHCRELVRQREDSRQRRLQFRQKLLRPFRQRLVLFGCDPIDVLVSQVGVIVLGTNFRVLVQLRVHLVFVRKLFLKFRFPLLEKLLVQGGRRRVVRSLQDG